uniref:(Atlantic silverside) hypothetical protein n=1 Tax=Menidia menidia TaxID=238744 RepID=A0A8S4AB41_9TELE|nr:unnamed protein product [Menidia menidia]
MLEKLLRPHKAALWGGVVGWGGGGRLWWSEGGGRPDWSALGGPAGLIWEMSLTDLEGSMAAIISVFQKYSEREGDKHKLKKSELKELLHDELPDLMAHVKDQSTLDSLMESLDADGDSECNFQEFMTFVSMVTICCHEFFEQEDE